MNEPLLEYDRLGPAFADAVEAAQRGRQGELARVRAALLESPPPRRAWWWFLWVPAVVTAALVAGWWWVVGQPLHYTVDGQVQPVDVWISADQHDAQLAFSDGSEVVFHRGTRGRVTEARPEGSGVLVESGRATVVGRSGWTVTAGPYAALGTGAHFVVEWQPKPGYLRVEVHTGAVELRGPAFEPLQALREGEVLEVEGGSVVIRRELEANLATPARDPDVDVEGPLPRTEKSVSGAKAGETSDARAGRAPRRSDPTEDWRAAAAREDYAAAFALVEDELEGLCRTLGPADLLRLADVARFSGHGDAATRALLLFRKRFPRSDDAATAAYTLGHIAAARGGTSDHREAARWFEIAVEERPRGPLHRSALARLITELDRSGALESAKQASKTYLERYPEGPHVERAQRILSR